VIVYEDDGATHVSVIKPTEMLRIVGNAELNEIASQRNQAEASARSSLRRAR